MMNLCLVELLVLEFLGVLDHDCFVVSVGIDRFPLAALVDAPVFNLRGRPAVVVGDQLAQRAALVRDGPDEFAV